MMSSAPWWPSSAGSPPRFATRRDPSRPSEGAAVAAVAARLGTPLIPWQRHVADVAGEKLEDGSYAYQVVIVSVPRQTGKTTLIRAMGTYRALTGRDVFYTAQTGKDARARWMDLVKALRLSPAFKTRVKIALRGGSEHVEFPGGGVFQAFAPTVESLHGYTPPTVVVDEAFAQEATAGELLMGAIGPAQFTIVDRQIWLVSTRGTASSTFFHDWIRRAREAGDGSRIALFDWGAADDQDPYDLDDIAAFHPGVGQTLGEKTLTAADVLAEVDNHTKAEYERAFANRETVTLTNLISPDTWRALPAHAKDVMPDQAGALTLTYDVAADRLSSAILATWPLDDGRVAMHVVRAGPGVGWLTAAVDDLATRWSPAAVGAVGSGPVLEVTAALRDLGHDINELTERDYAAACGHFLTRIDDRQLVHDGSDEIERSVTGLVTRPGAVDGVAFSRRHSAGDASPAVAATAGTWLVTRNATHTAPLIDFGVAS